MEYRGQEAVRMVGRLSKKTGRGSLTVQFADRSTKRIRLTASGERGRCSIPLPSAGGAP